MYTYRVHINATEARNHRDAAYRIADGLLDTLYRGSRKMVDHVTRTNATQRRLPTSKRILVVGVNPR